MTKINNKNTHLRKSYSIPLEKYKQLKKISEITKVSMSKLIRDEIELLIIDYCKQNNIEISTFEKEAMQNKRSDR